ncbi:calcium-binding protein [Polaromonas sp. CT11-55]|uniref:calcium-binding protein n=1 Tax=Polaromonas sp. CT11-55 TaxID=3243045 RepID=UPI0039A5272F
MTITVPNFDTLTQNQQAWMREYALLSETRRVNLAIRLEYEARYLAQTLDANGRKIYEDAAFKQMETERQLNGFRLDRSDVLDADFAKLQNELNRTPPDKLFLRNQLEISINQYGTAKYELWNLPPSMFPTYPLDQVSIGDKIYNNSGTLRWNPETFGGKIGYVLDQTRGELESAGRGFLNIWNMPDEMLSIDQKYNLCKTLSGMLGGFVGGNILTSGLNLPQSSMLSILLGKRGPTTPGQMMSDTFTLGSKWAFKTTGENGGCRIYMPSSEMQRYGLLDVDFDLDSLADFVSLTVDAPTIRRVLAEDSASMASLTLALAQPDASAEALAAAGLDAYNRVDSLSDSEMPTAFNDWLLSAAEGRTALDSQLPGTGSDANSASMAEVVASAWQESNVVGTGPVTNLINLGTNTDPIPIQNSIPDSASGGPSTIGNSLVITGDYTVGVGNLWDVNTAVGNQAAAGYAITDGLRPGNSNMGLNIGASTGVGLHVPAPGGTAGPGAIDYSLLGTGLNSAAASNFHQLPVDPLVIDLNGDGVQLTNYTDSPVLFDVDNDGGSLEQTGWVSSQDGIVVHDLNHDGKINSISETLSEYYNGVAGSNGMAGTKPFANGFAALSSLDSNHDNQFTNADATWSELRVWQDANHDGKTDASELKTFGDLGITAINLSTTAQSGEVRNGNEVLAKGSFIQNGSTHEAIAANFLANPAGSTITQSGSGIIVSTESTVAGGSATTAFISQNIVASVSESLSAAALGVKNITGGTGNDVLIGDAQNNWLAGGLGADSLNGGAGDDVLLIDARDTSVNGGDGFDIAQVIGTQGVTLNLSKSNIEMAVGGEGDDVLIGGGRSTVFVRGGGGDDVIIGGAANDVLSGEDGSDMIDGGSGNDLIRGHRGQDRLLGGQGDDVLDGGLEDDSLSGGAGNDVLIGGRGDDNLNGGDGIDVAQYSGSYADYRITKIRDEVSGGTIFRVVDTRNGQDGADTLTNIEKLSFSDVSRVDLTLAAPLPVKDVLSVNSSGVALSRSTAHLLSKTQLLANDRDWDSDISQLSITAVLEAKGGTVSLTAQGDVLFTPDANYTGVMSFKYKVQDAQGNYTQVTSTTGQTEPMKAAVYLQITDLPSDPLVVEQWYLSDTNVIAAWGTVAEQAAGRGYSGKGIKIGQFEPGGPFSTGPEVFDYRHPDLAPNADKAWLNTLDANGNNNAPQVFSNHATMVAGVMVAARNGEGGVGVAYNASLAGHYIQGEGLEVSQLNQEITAALAKFKNYDVVNNSWGPTANFQLNVTPVGLLETGMLDAVSNGRGGLGTAIVMAGGNDREHGANTNYNALTANRAVITVGSINAPGDLGTLQMGSKPFSNPGSSILVSAPGSNIDSTSRELIADNGSTFGSQYNTSQGTSFAAPIVSGVIALMLEANPKLGYRDIQTILAMSATQFADPNGTDWTYNTAKNWNGGGMHASHDYGFGKVDARAAVRLAETWYGQTTTWNEQTKTASSATLNAAIPDGAGVLTQTLTMAAGLDVETAQVTLELTHQRWGDLIIKLISPTGTESILVNRPGKAPGGAASDLGDTTSGTLSFSFNTTHVRGETSGGNWTLQVIDAATGSTGTLKNWKLDLYGATSDSDDVYVYTNEFASTAGRTTLTDTNGGSDIINASAVTGNSIINLNNGSTSTLAGKTLTLNGDIDKAFGGDGDDTLIGSAGVNVLMGGRGNDNITGGGGIDRLEGGYGNDTLTGGTEDDLFVVQKDAGSTDTIVDFNTASGAEKIVLVGFDSVTDATQLSVTQVGANVQIGLGQGQSIILSNTTVAQVSEQNFVFVSDASFVEEYAIRWNNPAFWLGTTGVDNQVISSPFGDLRVTALAGNDVVGSTTAKDLLDGGNGNDTLWGDYPGFTPVPGADWIEGGSGNDTLYGGNGGDWLVGGSGDDAEYGEEGNDYLIGNTGLDFLDGGLGDDLITLDGDVGTVNGTTFGYYGTRVGGAGADVFKVLANGGGNAGFSASGATFSASNLIADFDPNQAGEKIDLRAFGWITKLADLGIQNLIVNGVQFALISVSNGTQSLNLNIRGVSLSQLNASHFIFAPATPGAVTGTTGNDILTGDAGANTINGLAGADSMTGRTGDDSYIVDNVGDTINELPGGGYDSVQSSVNYTLSDNVEALTLTGTGNLNATGNAQRNRLVGNADSNRLDGGAEADSMLGGAGSDTYVVDDQLDTAYENFNEGIDKVESSVSWTLGSNFENLTLTGTGNINATGNDVSNILVGNSADNIIDGAQGADVMSGGAGNDTFYVDNAGDTVFEEADSGIDTVYTNVNLALEANVENGTLFGAATTLTGNNLGNILLGNSLSNTLSGAAGNDVLDGGAGSDTMAGGTGDDVYYVDNAGDTVVENMAEGVDTVVTSVNYALGANAENLVLTGASNLNGTGNALDNRLSGNSGNNTLTDSGGSDTIDGGAGDDVIVDQGDGANALRGGDGNDTITFSHSASNTIQGGTGNDLIQSGSQDHGAAAYTNTFEGGTGNDRIVSGSSSDTYLFNRGDGQDTINDYGASALGGTVGIDRIVFGAGITVGDVTISHVGSNLVLSINNPNNPAALDCITVENWNNSLYRIEQVQFGDGATLSAAQLDQTAASGTTNADVINISLDAILAYGLAGDDTIVVGAGGVIASGGDGNDTMVAAGDNNYLYGDAGNDVMTATGSNNHLYGGAGNDTYLMDVTGTAVSELADEGIDTVIASLDYTLGANVENLNLTGAANLSGTGNALNNQLTGNSGNNTLIGGLGNDALLGGSGNDLYVYGRGDGRDTITDVDTTVGNIDTLVMRADITAADVTVSRTATQLVLSISSSDQVRIDWDASHGKRIERVEFANGTVWDMSHLTALANLAPIVSEPVPLQNANEDSTWTFVVPAGTFSDADALVGDTMSYGACRADGTALPSWLSFNAATRTFSGTPVNADVGILSLKVMATDSFGATIATSFNVVVSNTNDAPILVNAPTAQQASESQMFVYVLPANTFTDVDIGDALTLSATLTGGAALPAWLTFDSNLRTLSGIPPNTSSGVLNITIKATDLAGAFTLTSLSIDIADVLNGTAGNDVLVGASGRDLLLGFAGNDSLDGGAGADSLIGGSGDDTYFVDNAGDSVTEATNDGWDTVIASLNYTLGANVENLVLTGAANLNGTGNALDNRLSGNSGNNTLTDSGGSDTIDGGAGDDAIVDQGGGTNTLRGGDGNDTITFSHSASNTIQGGTGNDLIQSGSQDHGAAAYTNTFEGGTGNDRIVSGSSSDTYLFNRGDGQDTINDYGASALGGTVGIDKIVFGAGIAVGDVKATRIGDNLVLSINNPSAPASIDRIVIENWNNSLYRIEQVLFADGTILSAAQLGQATVTSTSGSDVIRPWSDTTWVDGQAGDDTIIANGPAISAFGGDGNDVIISSGSSDLLDGGEGDDVITHLGGGTNVLRGGNGNDNITFSHTANNTIEGGVGDDVIQGDHQYFGDGSGHSNTFTGGAGDDRIVSGFSADTYIFNRGDGHDVINDYGFSAIDVLLGGLAGGDDQIIFGVGIAPSDVTVSREGSNLLLNINNPQNSTTSDRITIENWANNSHYIEKLRFADGTVLTASQLDQIFLASTTGADTIYVSGSHLVVHGGGGNDSITDTGYRNTLFGDAGDDTILGSGEESDAYGGDGNDIMTVAGGYGNRQYGGAGDDVISSDGWMQIMDGEAGNDTITALGSSGDSGLYGGAGDDILRTVGYGNTLDGGSGNDVLTVVDGDHSFLYGGAGDDLINITGFSSEVYGESGNDTIVSAGSGNQLYGGTGNDTYVMSDANNQVTENSNEGTDTVQSSVSWLLQANVENLTLTGTAAINGTGNTSDNVILGNSGNNTLNGAGGNDILQGGAGADTVTDTVGNNLFDGGAGNDTLTGGTGNEFIAGGVGNDVINTSTGADIIAFNRGDGQDTVNLSTGNDNTLSLGKGITYADLLFTKSSNDLILGTGTGEQITFKDWYTNINNRSVANLQIVIEGTSDYDSSSTNQLVNKKIEQFNFGGLVTRFDEARSANPTLSSWALSSSLLDFYLSSSDTAAIGGDLAYLYAKNGSFSDLSMAPAQALLTGSSFGSGNQNLQTPTALQDSSPRLL